MLCGAETGTTSAQATGRCLFPFLIIGDSAPFGHLESRQAIFLSHCFFIHKIFFSIAAGTVAVLGKAVFSLRLASRHHLLGGKQAG